MHDKIHTIRQRSMHGCSGCKFYKCNTRKAAQEPRQPSLGSLASQAIRARQHQRRQAYSLKHRCHQSLPSRLTEDKKRRGINMVARSRGSCPRCRHHGSRQLPQEFQPQWMHEPDVHDEGDIMSVKLHHHVEVITLQGQLEPR